MPSLVSDALAGFGRGRFGGGNNKDGKDKKKKDNPHAQFMNSFLVPTTVKIQKELRGRKFRDLQTKLQEAVIALHTFQEEPWPMRRLETPEWIQSSPAKQSSGYSTSIETMESEDRTEDTDTDSTTVGDMTQSTSAEQPNEELQPFDDMSVTSITATTTNDNSTAAANMEQNPKTRQPMHEAIICALEAYVQVMMHPSKTYRASEWVLECIKELVEQEIYISGRAGGRDDNSGSGAAHRIASQQQQSPTSDTNTKTTTTEAQQQQQQAQQQAQQATPPPPSLMHQIMTGIAKCSESNVESVQTRVVKAMKAIVTSDYCGVHEASLLLAVRSIFHIYLVTKSKTSQDLAKQALFEMFRSVFFKLEESTTSTTTLSSIASQYHTDTYVLFRSLCKLSSKELPGIDTTQTPGSFLAQQFSTASITDPLALSNKILSLELILAVMECAGDAFCQGDKFVHLVQTQLCVALLKNCTSNDTKVAFLSQKIFLILVYKFKTHLKAEIEVFMTNIFLRVLDSPNSSFKQKAIVLESLRSLCNNPLLITQIFLNYDCDFDAMNLYKDIVFHLTRLSGKSTAQPVSNLSKKDAEQHYELSLAGVEVLVAILKAFLKALGLPTDNGNNNSDDTAGAKIRNMLKLDGLNSTTYTKLQESTTANASATTDSQAAEHDDISEMSSPNLDFSSSFLVPSEQSERQQQQQQVNLGESSSDVAGKIVDAFDRKRTKEQNFELGAVKFTLSLKSGINFFIDNGFVELDAKQIALFFLQNKDKLDKTQIGEVLGKEPDAAFVKTPDVPPDQGGPGFFVRILHHYSNSMDFNGLLFDDAIRLFLSGFRLPGEAQKIDRIMEKFAERFTRQNIDVFPSADTAFILAFSVIMLNTDLHNPSIKPERRMTVDGFLRNNRGIGENGADLPEEFLTGIFERIQERPFSLKEDDAAREKAAGLEQRNYLFDGSLIAGAAANINLFGGNSAEERKREKFQVEREEMMAATEQLIRRRAKKVSIQDPVPGSSSQKKNLTDAVAPSDVVKPMFDVTWGPMIGILSQVLECSQDERHIAVCLNGFVYAIRVAAHSHMSLARDTFVNSLAKFTCLGTSIKEMQRKNIESIRTLLSIAVVDGEFLGECWGPVLQCISQLARIRMSASGLDSDESFLLIDANGTSNGDRNDSGHASYNGGGSISGPTAEGSGLFRTSTKFDNSRETEEMNGQAILAAFDEVLIEKVFSNTVKLSAGSLAHFIQQLIDVSNSEVEGDTRRNITGVASSLTSPKPKINSGHGLSGDDGPSIFSLQRLVEVADYNMDVRPRLVWTQVWEIMADFFAKIGCHRNSMVSVFAIDSLKQLSFKFLDKPELSEFHFQRIFLRPFLQIMENPGTREDIRELILQCMDNAIRTKSHNLKSGWQIIFYILTVSASDSSERITFLGLNILQRLLDEHLDKLCRLSSPESQETKQDDVADANGDSGPAPVHAASDSHGSQTDGQLTALERRSRNANAEDFILMCRASLAFVQRTESDSPRPIGSSMRALCHTAIFADLLAQNRVLPPVSDEQWTDPEAPGYTYKGLPSQKEALEMVLWRPLLEGLADGVQCKVKTSAGGVGCLVQRGSILALRAIFLRHGSLFSVHQWQAILQQTLLPAIQSAVESETDSPVISITSESPSVSNLDFLADAPALPPRSDDKGLLKFEAVARHTDCAPKRLFGAAELLLEASFTDMRHGGDGNLSVAYRFAKKDMRRSLKNEQPFPNSWIATTAPLALGLLTDILTEFVIYLGEAGERILWPCIGHEYHRWCNGNYNTTESGTGEHSWSPCEAVVRIAGREIQRFCSRLVDVLPCLSVEESSLWMNSFCKWYQQTLSSSLEMETAMKERLVKLKLKAYKLASKGASSSSPERKGKSRNTENGDKEGVVLDTPYGKGSLMKQRIDSYNQQIQVTVNIISLDFGILYQPLSVLSGDGLRATLPDVSVEEDGLPETEDVNSWLTLVPSLKIRCVAAHCLHQALQCLDEQIVLLLEEKTISSLLQALNESRQMAETAVRNEDLAHAFQEALLNEWGQVEVVEETLVNVARLSQTQGSAMFFLTQTAGATNTAIYLLRALYQIKDEYCSVVVWDRETFAAPHLLEIMKDVLYKFVTSEEKDGHRIDPNVWRNSSESGGKVAIYCTSFAAVVVGILKAMLSFSVGQFERQKNDFFPIVCRLVRVQSEEIRSLVQRILLEKFGPMLGINDADAQILN